MSKQLFLEQNQRPGESYAGIKLGFDGEPDYHVFEQPRESGKFTFQGGIERARQLSTSEFTIHVATPEECQLLRINSANSRGNTNIHWTSKQRPYDSGYAYVQGFADGDTDFDLKSNQWSVAFVRRVLIIQ